ncbi:hypothetical protein C8Q76DRAFT_792690 [Earliella scabrosa]|nr:hypothetical protein C8Q76DRAFT_792690 [Earliella scabrosa]
MSGMLNDPSALVPLYQGVQVDAYCQFASAVLIVYDYITTLDREISLYWSRRIDGSTILFALNRYFYMVLDVYTIFVAFLVTDEMTLSLLSVRDAANNASFVSIFIQPVTSILITRFLFNLQYAKRNAESHEDSTPDGSLGTLVFDRVVGCIDSTIEPGGYLSSDLGQESMELKSFDGVELAGTAASEEGR